MLRVFATIVLPLVLPTALYLCWITFVQRTDVITARHSPIRVIR